LELFAVWTAGGEELEAAFVVLVVELVEDEDPQAAAMAAAGSNPRRMARLGLIQGRCWSWDLPVLLDVVAVSARITGSFLGPARSSPGAGSDSVTDP
jgi:hypothetical protein